MPWQNAGEGWLPTLTGSLAGGGTSDPSRYMDDYRSTAYKRMSEEAIKNTTDWIMMTSGIDPNLRIEGIDSILRANGLYSTDDSYLAAETVGTGGSTRPDDPALADPLPDIDDFTGFDDKETSGGDYELDVEYTIDQIREIFGDDVADDAEKMRKDKEEAAKDDTAQTDEEQKRLEEAAEDQAYHDMIARRNAARAADKERRGEEYLQTDEIETWREQGIRLGLLEPDGTRPTDSNSHVADSFVPTVDHDAESVLMHHSVDHEDFHVPAMSSAFLAAIHHAESSAPSAVKVI